MKRFFASVALLAGLAAACSPYKITRNQADNLASWSAYRTYAFIDTSRMSPVPGGAYQTAVEAIKQSVAAQLRDRGYQPTTNNPDLLVNLGVVAQEKTQTRQTTIWEAPRYIGQRRYSWQSQEVPVGTYREGTANLHVIDAQKNALIWDVAVSSVISQNGIKQNEIDKAVAKVFEKFPGRK